jgi:uncharacterized protein with PhoU and TrkA domain
VGDTPIQPGDILIAIGKAEALQKLHRLVRAQTTKASVIEV